MTVKQMRDKLYDFDGETDIRVIHPSITSPLQKAEIIGFYSGGTTGNKEVVIVCEDLQERTDKQ